VIDIADPLNPHIVGAVDTPGAAGDVVVSANHAYVADGWSGLAVVDVTDPHSPRIIAQGVIDRRAACVALAADRVYVGSHTDDPNGSGKLFVIDVANPASPQVLAEAVTPGMTTEVAVSGNEADSNLPGGGPRGAPPDVSETLPGGV